jgi:hypothetical protein
MYLPQPPPEVAVTCRHYVAAVLPHTLADTVICICAAVHAWQALYSWVLQHIYGFRTIPLEIFRPPLCVGMGAKSSKIPLAASEAVEGTTLDAAFPLPQVGSAGIMGGLCLVSRLYLQN